MGTSEMNLPLTLTFKNSSLNVNLSALYISFSSKDSTTLLWEILYVLLGFFSLTLIMIIVMAVAFRRRAGFTVQADQPGGSFSEGAGYSPRQARAGAGEGAGTPPMEDQPEELASVETGPPIPPGNREDRYSALSGLVRSEYFEARLTEEIERAASFDQDLALIMISIEKVASSTFSLREDFTAVLHHFFPLHDLAFEYGKDVYAVVVPDESVDAAITTAKLIYKELFERRVSVSMGLSSRNGRLPGASILINEAAEALSQAKEEGHSPIIAFRPDPG
jgi:GGDEF domain-containing protein